MQVARCCFKLRGKGPLQHLAPRRGFLDIEVCGTTAERMPKLLQGSLTNRIVQQCAHLIHELIATGAVNCPVIRQFFTTAQNLFHDDPDRAPSADLFKACTEATAVPRRIGQSIDVIDPESIDEAFPIETEQCRVSCFEHCFIFYPYSCQAVDVEETPPIDLIAATAPPGQPVVLSLQQTVQSLPAHFGRWIIGIGGETGDL